MFSCLGRRLYLTGKLKKMKDYFKIALFADLHGRIFLCLKLVERLQRERGIEVDLILQCGDMGIFPYLHRLDKATKRHAERDRTELGFHEYFVTPNPKVTALLEKIQAPFVCVRGNHEDHLFLNDLEKQARTPRFTVDCYDRISVCKTGYLQQFKKAGIELNLAGIGRIGKRFDKAHVQDEKYIQRYEQTALKKFHKNNLTDIDILISHDKEHEAGNRFHGMAEIRTFLDKQRPILHFHGHTGKPFNIETDENEFTQVVKIKELEFKRDGTLPEGCFILLHWKDAFDYKLEVIEEDWMKEYMAFNWEFL